MDACWEYATLEISAVGLDDGDAAAGERGDSAEWQIYAIGPSGELILEEYRPYRVAWARVYAEQLNRLGKQGWEVVAFAGPQNALVPSAPGLGVGTAPHVVETRFVLRRPAG
ncbi:hypothetical protein [Actinomycetospora cinnamomea]|uniref:DUF4177 domain-containing protein n=1 Tax=Actinomycetospora cinnamomea TaxID=663609 RepID=A0A2U1FA65_9PSEU|nr:hypothetical protein [Actinomycetospora cinnamomea]PVZ09072.1 hypothetical protein C8D89_107236 [Actinomycetospora cinnamomea]